ncbi:MAG: diguanylate cyclase [Myxococcota bacterium]
MDILVVDDDATTRARLAFLLRRNGFSVELAEDGARACSQLERQHFALILTDWAMPQMDGLALCKRIRGAKYPDYTYIILLTGHSEKSEVTRGLEAGADDYITKPFDSGELLARIRVGQRILGMQKQMKEQQRQLKELASVDGLTGVLNRRELETRLHEHHALAQRRLRPLSVALLDLDRFKAINDTYGPQAGDRVLQEVASRIRDVTRQYDSVGRYGGEEFMVVIAEASAVDARSAADRILRVVEARPVEFQGTQIPVTTSIGLATCRFPQQKTVAELVAAADRALYEAKRLGRNRVISCGLGGVDFSASSDDIAAEVG